MSQRVREYEVVVGPCFKVFATSPDQAVMMGRRMFLAATTDESHGKVEIAAAVTLIPDPDEDGSEEAQVG